MANEYDFDVKNLLRELAEFGPAVARVMRDQEMNNGAAMVSAWVEQAKDIRGRIEVARITKAA